MEHDCGSIVGTDKNDALKFQIGLLLEIKVGELIDYPLQIMT